MSDLFSPIQFYAKNTCPMCRQGHLLLYTIEGYASMLGTDGKPNDNVPMSYSERVYCPVCNFQTNIGDIDKMGAGIFLLKDGTYKYMTRAERIYYANKDKEKERRHVGVEEDENPFIEEDEKDVYVDQ